jgi:hypothetical protein
MKRSRSAGLERCAAAISRWALLGACVWGVGITNPGQAEPPAPRPLADGAVEAVATPPSVESPDAAANPNSPKVVLLRGGRTVQGIVSKNGENYVLRKPTGEMFLPATHVLHIATDLRGLYRHLHDTLPGESPPDEHFALGKWCLEKQLLSEARLELVEVLRHDSAREDARRMIARLDDVLVDPLTKPSPEAAAANTEKAILRARYGISDLQSLGGLTREQSRTFSTRVLPILLNNCSKSGCHGGDGSGGGFRLERLPVAESSRKMAVTRNLEHVLEKIDRARPAASPLLTANTGPHAPASRVVITGPKGAEQLRTLREWVESLADASGRDNRRESSPSREAETDQDSGLASHRSTDGSDLVRTAAATGPGVSGTEYDAVELVDGEREAKSPAAKPVSLDAPRKSPFDPTDFNSGRDQPR